MEKMIANRIVGLIIVTITFILVFFIYDYTFKAKVNKVIEENPNITLQEFMGGVDNYVKNKR